MEIQGEVDGGTGARLNTVYQRNEKTGALTKVKVYDTGKNPSWVEIIPLKDAIFSTWSSKHKEKR